MCSRSSRRRRTLPCSETSVEGKKPIRQWMLELKGALGVDHESDDED